MSEPKKEIVLKPCPFCGKDAAYTGNEKDVDNITSYYVWCSHCLAMVDEYMNEEAAIQAWNQRSHPEGLVKLDENKVKELRNKYLMTQEEYLHSNMDSLSWARVMNNRIDNLLEEVMRLGTPHKGIDVNVEELETVVKDVMDKMIPKFEKEPIKEWGCEDYKIHKAIAEAIISKISGEK